MKINKPCTNEQYADFAVYCNENNLIIEDGGDYLESAVFIKPQSIINAERIAELQNYLNKTDWNAVRFVETGVEIPEDIKTARQSAREEISHLRGDDDQNSDQGSVGH